LDVAPAVAFGRAVGDPFDRCTELRCVGGVTDFDLSVEDDTVGVVDMVDQSSIAEPAVVDERLDGGVARVHVPTGGRERPTSG
jgi:hypothetical protein